MRRLAIGLFFCMGLAGFDAAEGIELGGVDIHGFISQGFLKSDDNDYLVDSENGSFQFSEIGINFSRELSDNLRIGLQVFARDLGQFGNHDVEIDWAFGDYRWRDWLGLRVGIIRMAHGLYNETRDIDALRTSVLLPQSIYREDMRDFFSRLQGGGLYGDISLGWAGSLAYQALLGTIDIDTEGRVAENINATGFIKAKDFNEGVFYNGGFQWRTPIDGLRLGITGMKTTDIETELEITAPLGPDVMPGARVTDELDTFWTYVYSAEYVWNDLVMMAEYSQVKTRGTIRELDFTTVGKPEGYYVGAAYRLTDWFEIGGYHSWYYSDKDDHDGDRFETDSYRAWLKDLALSVRLDINDHWIAKVEGHVMDGAASTAPGDNDDGMEKNWFLFAGKVTFSF